MHISQSTRAALAAVVIAVAAAGCATNTGPTASRDGTYGNAVAYGTVESIEATTGAAERGGPGLGAAAGAVVGGVLGNQVGAGRGRAAATVGGAVAGGLVGNEAEQRMGNRAPGQAYRVRVRLDNGSTTTLTQDAASDLRIGGRVRVENGRAYPL